MYFVLSGKSCYRPFCLAQIYQIWFHCKFLSTALQGRYACVLSKSNDHRPNGSAAGWEVCINLPSDNSPEILLNCPLLDIAVRTKTDIVNKNSTNKNACWISFQKNEISTDRTAFIVAGPNAPDMTTQLDNLLSAVLCTSSSNNNLFSTQTGIGKK